MKQCLLRLILVSFTYVVNADFIRFDVISAPRAVILGQDLVLNCSATYMRQDNSSVAQDGSVPLFYQWIFNGDPIDQSVRSASVFSNHTLFVPVISTAELGVYNCRVSSPNEAISATSDAISIVEAYLEAFIEVPNHLTAAEGEAADLSCVTGWSAPPALVTWLRNGRPFTGGQQTSAQFGEAGFGGAARTSANLHLSKASPEQAGLYVCSAFNTMNNEEVRSSSADFTVLAEDRAPYITGDLPAEALLPEGHPHILGCPILGWPLPDLLWYKSGVEVVTQGHITAHPNGSLEFAPVLRSDQGVYICVGSNAFGSTALHPVNISVAYLDFDFAVEPPPFTSAVAGQSLVLKCQPPQSHPPASITWFREAAPVIMRGGEFGVSPNSLGHLVFKNIQIDDSASYICVAENSFAVPADRSSSVAVVSVTASATLVEPPLQQRILKGSLLTLHCGALGNPLPQVTWYLEGQEVTPNRRISLVDRGQDLVVDDANKLDEGFYFCRATNIYGTAKSAAVFVFVIVPPELTLLTENVAASEGSSIRLKCSFYGDPKPTVTWSKDEEKLDLSLQRYHADDDGLRIASVEMRDQGMYTCIGSNEGGVAQSHGRLIIQGAPAISSLPSDITLIETEALQLHCDATGSPHPKVHWLFNGTASYPPNVVFSKDQRSLRVYSVSPEHSGVYTCNAENILDVTEKSVNVHIQTRPEVVNITGDLLIEKGNSLRLLCTAEGIPLPLISFHKDGEALASTPDRRVEVGSDGSLLVRFVAEEDRGVYGCKARNVAGTDEKSVQVMIQGDPLPPVLLNSLPMSQHSVNITWQPVLQISATVVQSYVLQYKLFHLLTWLDVSEAISLHPSWFEISVLSPAAHYVFRMASISDVNRVGPFSNVLGATTFASAPSEPRSLLARNISSRGATLLWMKPVNTNGQIALYQLNYREKYGGEQYIEEVHPSISASQTSYFIGGLSPYLTYECKVRAGNVQNGSTLWGEYSTPFSFTTAMAAPSASPTNVHIINITSTSVRLSWTPIKSSDQNGVLRYYRIQYRIQHSSRFDSKNIPANTSTAEVKGLLPWQQYDIQISGFNDAGYGPYEALSVKTLADVPSEEPINVQARALSSQSIEVRWQPVPMEGRNSDISGYLVLYRPYYDSDSTSIYQPTPTYTRLNISGLNAWTQYKVQVQAYTTQVYNGFGPLSPEVTVLTKEDIPGKIYDLNIAVSGNSARLSWLPPITPNGLITRYSIIYALMINPHEDHRKKRHTTKVYEHQTQFAEFLIQNLEPHSEYFVGVSAQNSVGTGPLENSTFETPEASTSSTSSTSTSTSTTVSPTPSMEIFTDSSKDVIVKEVEPPAASSGLSTGQVVGLVIGVTMLAVLLTVIIILLVYCCIRRRKQTLLQTDTPAATYRPTDNKLGTAANAPVQRAPPQEGSVISSSTAQSSATSTSDNTHYSYHPTNHRNIPPIGDGTRDGAVGKRENEGVQRKQEMEEMYRDPVFTVTPPKLTNNMRGIDNPAYEGWLSEFGNPYSTVQDLPPELRVSTRTNKHMRSDIAAAIASQRNRETSVFADSLPTTQPDAIVVYRERTAL